MTSKTIWIIAGETSGDIYGARLAKALKSLDPELRVAGMGAGEMRSAGVEIMVDSTELGVVGALEILSKIVTFVKVFLGLVARARRERPDAVVLIDYPGFNIRFAKRLWKSGIPVVWYISPQVWAWRKSNIPKLAAYCRKMMVIFPFEVETYQGTGLDVEFAGHPLVDIVNERRRDDIQRDPNRVVLLPGSRSGEITRLLPEMLATVVELKRRRPELTFAIAAPREKIRRLIQTVMNDFAKRRPGELPELELSVGETARWLQEAGTGLAASGTITVECAIAGLPLVVVYKLNPITFLAARMVITLFRGFFTMTNIIADKTVYEEFLQHQVKAVPLADAMERILPGGERRREVENDMRSVAEALSTGSANASRRAAEICLESSR